MFARVGIGADSAQLRAALSEEECRLKQLQKSSSSLSRALESAKTKAHRFLRRGVPEAPGRLSE